MIIPDETVTDIRFLLRQIIDCNAKRRILDSLNNNIDDKTMEDIRFLLRRVIDCSVKRRILAALNQNNVT